MSIRRLIGEFKEQNEIWNRTNLVKKAWSLKRCQIKDRLGSNPLLDNNLAHILNQVNHLQEAIVLNLRKLKAANLKYRSQSMKTLSKKAFKLVSQSILLQQVPVDWKNQMWWVAVSYPSQKARIIKFQRSMSRMKMNKI